MAMSRLLDMAHCFFGNVGMTSYFHGNTGCCVGRHEASSGEDQKQEERSECDEEGIEKTWNCHSHQLETVQQCQITVQMLDMLFHVTSVKRSKTDIIQYVAHTFHATLFAIIIHERTDHHGTDASTLHVQLWDWRTSDTHLSSKPINFVATILCNKHNTKNVQNNT